MRVLAALSPEQRSVLLLRVIGDMSIEDVAKAVGKRTGAGQGAAAAGARRDQARTGENGGTL